MPQKPTAAVLMFPGSNCELEAVSALERNGFAAKVVRWNEPEELKKVDAIVIAGGFSYEDRGRSGLIASRDPTMAVVAEMAKRGAVVLGICNGAQVLVETGLVPNFEFGKSTIALAHNHFPNGESYFINRWVHLTSGAERGTNAFNDFDGVIHVPLAHAEGRFTTTNAQLLEAIVKSNLNAFAYSTTDGEIDPTFPTNPNGSVLNLAGLTNLAGNVMALMPHPERTTNGDAIFASMHRWIVKHGARSMKHGTLKVTAPKIEFVRPPKCAVELFIALKITDNEALSVAQVAREKGLDIRLAKYRYVGLNEKLATNELEKLIRSGDVLNTEKEAVWVKTGKQTYHFHKMKGLVAEKFTLPKNAVLVTEIGADKKRINGMVWALSDGTAKDFDAAIAGQFFHHPAAQQITKIG